MVDRREENGDRKLDEEYLFRLYEVVASDPEAFGWRRPTWTRELLMKTMYRETGIRIHVATMSRDLKAIGARRGRPAGPYQEIGTGVSRGDPGPTLDQRLHMVLCKAGGWG